MPRAGYTLRPHRILNRGHSSKTTTDQHREELECPVQSWARARDIGVLAWSGQAWGPSLAARLDRREQGRALLV